MGESQTHTTRSVGSNPTHGVEVSGAEFATEVGDGGGGAVLCAVGVGKENMNSKILFASYDETFFSLLSRNRIILSFSCFEFFILILIILSSILISVSLK